MYAPRPYYSRPTREDPDYFDFDLKHSVDLYRRPGGAYTPKRWTANVQKQNFRFGKLTGLMISVKPATLKRRSHIDYRNFRNFYRLRKLLVSIFSPSVLWKSKTNKFFLFLKVRLHWCDPILWSVTYLLKNCSSGTVWPHSKVIYQTKSSFPRTSL